MEDLRELLRVGSTPGLNLVVLCDRSPESSAVEGYSNERLFNVADFHSALLLRLGHEEATVLEDWGEQDMADGATLRRFLEEGVRRFPARRYGLVLADHGNGWGGLCLDDSGPEDEILTLDEVARALEESAPARGGRKLDLVSFDACLMASVEVALAVAPYGRIMVASEELEPLSGWDYLPVVRALEVRPDLEASALGKLAVQSFRRSFANSPLPEVREEGRASTLSVLDLERMPPLRRALDRFGRAGLEDLSSRGRAAWLDLARARSRTEQYGSEGLPEDPGSAALDLGDLARRVARASPESEPGRAAREVLRALEPVVLARYHGELRPESTGLSVFLPPDRETLEDFAPAVYRKLPGMPSAWQDLVERYAAMVRPDRGEPLLAGLRVDRTRLRPGREHLELEARVLEPLELDRAWFVVLEADGSDRVVVGQEPLDLGAPGPFRRCWDGSLLTLGAGDPEEAIRLPVSSAEGRGLVARAQVRQGQGAWRDVQLHLEAGRLARVTLEGTGRRRPVHLAEGDRLRARYLAFDQEGVAGTTPGEEELRVPAHPGDLEVRRAPLPAGGYEVGFLVYDFDGDRALETRPVTLRD